MTSYTEIDVLVNYEVYDWENYEENVNKVFPVPKLDSDEPGEKYTYVSDEEAAKVVAQTCLVSEGKEEKSNVEFNWDDYMTVNPDEFEARPGPRLPNLRGVMRTVDAINGKKPGPLLLYDKNTAESRIVRIMRH